MLCIIASEIGDVNQEGAFVGYYQNGDLRFSYSGQLCINDPYELIQNIFSRNSGLIESDIMLSKGAIISGCGSVGSFVALDLARAGVGNFLLIDNDVIAYHNICRHQCGVFDVGKYKVDAVKERILAINPVAKVVTVRDIIEGMSKDTLENWLSTTPPTDAIAIGCADNREGDLYANQLSCLYGFPLISIGLWQRAFAGEIFYSIPGETPCYACLVGNTEVISERVSANHRFYIGEENLETAHFEPGISADILFVTTIGIKIAIDLLNRANDNYIPKVVHELRPFTFVCNTTDVRIGGEMAEIFSYPLQVTRSLVVDKIEGCRHCALVKTSTH